MDHVASMLVGAVTKRKRWRLSTKLLLSQLAVLLVVALAGEVTVGFLERRVITTTRTEILLLAGATAITLLLGVAATLLLARYLKRSTFGLEFGEFAPMLRSVERMAASRESLRRVATLVANGAPRAEVFSAVAQEAGRLTDADAAQVCVYAPDGSLARVAAWGTPAGTTTGTTTEATTEAGPDETGGTRPVVSAPIVVDGRTLGFIEVASPRSEPVGDDIDARLTAFAELAATAIANAQARADLAASRKRVMTAADEERRKIERNLHDGIQQGLVTLALQLGQAYDACPGPPELREQLLRMTEELANLLEELREISHGVHPAILSQSGLGPALRSLGRRAAVPVQVRVDVPGRLPEPLEVAAYYVVSEALANAAKHSGASAAEVDVAVNEGTLLVRISDDGDGGADEGKGSGIVGLRDRVEALGGTIALASPPGGGTAIRVELPDATPPSGQRAAAPR